MATLALSPIPLPMDYFDVIPRYISYFYGKKKYVRYKVTILEDKMWHIQNDSFYNLLGMMKLMINYLSIIIFHH